ncbi:unnamed protein product, partial [Prorocentrum cordatum]
ASAPTASRGAVDDLLVQLLPEPGRLPREMPHRLSGDSACGRIFGDLLNRPLGGFVFMAFWLGRFWSSRSASTSRFPQSTRR